MQVRAAVYRSWSIGSMDTGQQVVGLLSEFPTTPHTSTPLPARQKFIGGYAGLT